MSIIRNLNVDITTREILIKYIQKYLTNQILGNVNKYTVKVPFGIFSQIVCLLFFQSFMKVSTILEFT